MGSHLAKRKKPSDENAVLQEDPEPKEPPATDPRLPLTAREVYRLTSSWKAIKRNMEATGVEMFINFFKSNTSLQEQFKGFKGISLDGDGVYENEALAHHARLVMGALDRAISNLNDVDHVFDICSRVGSSHRRFAGFDADLFKRMEEPFLRAVKQTLGDRYNENMERIYRIIGSFLIGEISKGFVFHQANTSQGLYTNERNDLNKNQTKAEEKFGDDFGQIKDTAIVANGKDKKKDNTNPELIASTNKPPETQLSRSTVEKVHPITLQS